MSLEDILKVAESLGFNREEVGRKIQKKYATCIRKGNLDELRSLQKITGIKPGLPKDLVQKKYAAYIRKRQLSYLSCLQDLTGIKPSKDIVQKGYADYVKKGQLNDFSNLQEITRIEPSKDVYRAFIYKTFIDILSK